MVATTQVHQDLVAQVVAVQVVRVQEHRAVHQLRVWVSAEPQTWVVAAAVASKAPQVVQEVQAW